LGWRFKERCLLLGRGCRCGRLAHDRAAGPGLKDRESHRRDDECHEESGRELVQQRRRATRAERRLRSAAAKSTRQIRTLALLDKDDEDQEEADEDVNDYKKDDHRFSGACL